MKDLKLVFSRSIVEWGNTNLRDFAWRKNKTPYRILISEILLQRTTAEQVNSIFSNFIKNFPKPEKLVKSSDSKILKIIKPLGLYQRRLKVLKKISNQLTNLYKGRIPDGYDDLIKLFGVGKYIANAILCFSYNKKVPIVDTNVIRIFMRFFNFKSSKKYAESDLKLWEYAQSLLPDDNCQLYNYSLLDFGNLICKPKNPLCEECILNKNCYYYINKTNHDEL